MSAWLSIVIPSAIAVVTLLASKFYPKIMPNYIFAVLLILIVASATFGAIRYANEQKNIDVKWNFQELRPRLVEDITYPAIALGSAKLVWQGEPSTPIFDLGDPVSVWLENGELKVSLVLRDEKGQIIARLDANRFAITKDLHYDYNFDSTALEIVDSRQNVLLQIQLKEGVADLKAIFHDKNGWTYAMGDNIIEKRPPGESVELSFKPLFRHPGYKYIGERLSSK